MGVHRSHKFQIHSAKLNLLQEEVDVFKHLNRRLWTSIRRLKCRLRRLHWLLSDIEEVKLYRKLTLWMQAVDLLLSKYRGQKVIIERRELGRHSQKQVQWLKLWFQSLWPYDKTNRRLWMWGRQEHMVNNKLFLIKMPFNLQTIKITFILTVRFYRFLKRSSIHLIICQLYSTPNKQTINPRKSSAIIQGIKGQQIKK